MSTGDASACHPPAAVGFVTAGQRGRAQGGPTRHALSVGVEGAGEQRAAFLISSLYVICRRETSRREKGGRLPCSTGQEGGGVVSGVRRGNMDLASSPPGSFAA